MSRCSANLAYRCTKGWPLLSQRALLNRPLPQMVPCCKPAPLPHTHTHTHTQHLLLIGARFSFQTHFGLKIHFHLYYWGSLNSASLFCISRQYCALIHWFSQRAQIWFVTFTFKNLHLTSGWNGQLKHNGFLSQLFYYEFRSLICICPLFTQGAETKGQLWKHLALPKGSGLDVMSVLPACASICSSTTEVSGSRVPAYWGRAAHMASIGQPLHWGMTDSAHADSCRVPRHTLWPAPNIMYIRGAQTGRGLSERSRSRCRALWS